MPETYGYVRPSRPRVSELWGSVRKPDASSCRPPAWHFLTFIKVWKLTEGICVSMFISTLRYSEA